MTKQELKIKNENLFLRNTMLLKENQKLRDKITALLNGNYQTENEKLEEENNKLLDVISNYEVKFADLEQQIDKMKCCGNCKWQVCDECGEFCDYKGMSGVSGDCDKWEIKE